MKRIIFLIAFAVLIAGCQQVAEAGEKPIQEVEKMDKGKILIIVSQEDYQPVEYKDTRDELEKAGYSIDVASVEQGTAKAIDSSSVKVISVKDASLDDYKAVAVIGGPGALSLGESDNFINLIKEAASKGLVIGAICVSPLNIAKAGVLEGKKATVWCDAEKSQGRELEGYGAEFVDEPVVVDGRTITANGPSAAKDFGKKIAEVLG